MKCPLCNGIGEVDMGAMALGDQLRFCREKAGLSLREVEARSGVSNAVLSQYESGKVKQPSFQAVMRLCDVYGINPKELSL